MPPLMKKELIARLITLSTSTDTDSYSDAIDCLLEYIGDDDITDAFRSILTP